MAFQPEYARDAVQPPELCCLVTPIALLCAMYRSHTILFCMPFDRSICAADGLWSVCATFRQHSNWIAFVCDSVVTLIVNDGVRHGSFVETNNLSLNFKRFLVGKSARNVARRMLNVWHEENTQSFDTIYYNSFLCCFFFLFFH